MEKAPSQKRREESQSCAAKVADLQSRLVKLRTENIALRSNNDRLASELDECRSESLKQPLVWRVATTEHEERHDELRPFSEEEGRSPRLSIRPAECVRRSSSSLRT